MATVCNPIIPALIVTLPSNCNQFTESQQFSANCGSGTASDTCSITISGGQPPYNTVFSYPQVPTATNCTLNMSAFTGGSGANPQFGYSFTAPNLCSMSIMGQLRVNYTVTDASGQTVTGTMLFSVSIDRKVVYPSGGSGACVTLDSYIDGMGLASTVKVGDIMPVIDPITFERGKGTVSVARVDVQPVVRISTSKGYTLECSTTAPIAVKGGDGVLPDSLLGKMVPVVVNGEVEFDEVVNVESLGEKEVMYITCENNYFLAGAQEGIYLLHHNAKMPPLQDIPGLY